MAGSLFSKIKKIPRKLEAKSRFRRDKKEYSRLNKRESFRVDPHFLYPCLNDWYESAGKIDSYFWQDLWASKLIYKNNPEKHYDIGSRVTTFIAPLLAFRDEVYLIDVRPLDISVPGLHFIQADATMLEGIEDDSLESLSALCSLEHFGLGRYGDPIDPESFFKAMSSIARVMKPGGLCYIAVPIGYEHVEYNAHRVFYAQTVVDAAKPLVLKSFSVTIGDGIEENVDLHKYDNDKESRGERFGLFLFTKE